MTKTVLSVGAHPDDIEIGCGGTLLLLRQKGYQMVHIVVSSGEAGSLDIPPKTLSKIREKEAQSAANHLQARVIFLRAPDGGIQDTPEFRRKMIRLIRQVRPEILFVHASCDRFADHAAVNRLVTTALAVAPGPWVRSAGKPFFVPNVFGYEVWNPMSHPQWISNIETSLKEKLKMIGRYASQIHAVDYRLAIEGLARYRGIMSLKSQAAEAFEVMRMTSLESEKNEFTGVQL